MLVMLQVTTLASPSTPPAPPLRNGRIPLEGTTRHGGQALSYHLVGSNDPCEDVLLLHNSNRGDRPSLFAVIDGHGGRVVADHVHRQLPVEFDKCLSSGLLPGIALPQALAAVEASVLQASASNQQMYTAGACLVAAAVAARAPGAELDVAPSANEPTETAGGQLRHSSTSIKLTAQQEHAAPLITANLGDSRAVLGLLYEGEVLPYEMSEQHNCSNVVEVLRLQAEFPAAKLGAEVVVNKAQADDPRVCGISQVTRSIGDSFLKGLAFGSVPAATESIGGGNDHSGDSKGSEPAQRKRRRKAALPVKLGAAGMTEAPNVMSAVPHVDGMTDELMDSHFAPACFLLLASDGLFDQLSNGEACSLVDAHVRAGGAKATAAKALVEAATKRAAFKQNDALCTTEWLRQLPAGVTDEDGRSRRDVTDDIGVLVVFFR